MAFSATEQAFILEWTDKWCHLRELIFHFLRTDDTSRSYRLPGGLDHITYQHLHSWFLDNEKIPASVEGFLYVKRMGFGYEWWLDSRNQGWWEGFGEPVYPLVCTWRSNDTLPGIYTYIIDKHSGRPNEERAWVTAMDLLTWDVIVAAICYVHMW